MTPQDEHDMAERHVRQGQHHIAAQRRIIVRLGALGADTRLAEDVLANLKSTQRMHLAQLTRVRTAHRP